MAEKLKDAHPMLFILAGCLFAAYIYFSDTSTGAVENKINKVKAEIQKQEGLLRKAQNITSEKSKHEQLVAETSRKLNAALELMPTGLRNRELWEHVADEARAAGIQVKSLKPAENKTTSFYEELRSEIVIEGTYSRIALFLNFMSSRIRKIIHFQEINIQKKSSKENKSNLEFKATLVGYRYLEGSK